MLIDNRTDKGERLPHRPHRPLSRGVVIALTLAVLAVLLLRHDWWQWRTPGYLLFGFLPIGLWWQALVSLAAAAVMALLVRFAWPDHLEHLAEPSPPPAPEPPSAR